jgi:hypothetical protein
MDQATSVQATPLTKPPFDASDIEDTLNRAFHMSSIAVMLLEKALNVYEHYGDKAYHEKRRKDPSPYGTYLIHKQDEGTLLWSVYEAHAQIREARDQFVAAADNKGPQATAGEIAAE